MRWLSILVHSVVWSGVLGVSAWCWIAADRSRAIAAAQLQSPAIEDVVYRTVGQFQAALDVYKPRDNLLPPRSTVRRPVILAIHGGSWSGGSRRLFRSYPRNETLLRLIQAGYVVIAADYRLARPGFPGWPEALDDVREAVRWIKRHAAEFEMDPDRIAALGQSAGAHLALLLGTLPDPANGDGISSRVAAVVSFYGPSDLNRLAETRRRLTHDPTSVFVGGKRLDFSARATQASPMTHVSIDDVPTLLIHGSDDLWVPVEQSKRLAESLERAGVRSETLIVDGAAHGFEAEVRTQPNQDLLPQVLGFLESVWNAQSR